MTLRELIALIVIFILIGVIGCLVCFYCCKKKKPAGHAAHEVPQSSVELPRQQNVVPQAAIDDMPPAAAPADPAVVQIPEDGVKVP